MTTDNDRRILKYHVPIGGEHTIELSIFGDIVHVDWEREGDVTFWVMDNPRNTRREYTFRVFASFTPIAAGWKHLGSASRHTSAMHLFVQGVECRRLP